MWRILHLLIAARRPVIVIGLCVACVKAFSPWQAAAAILALLLVMDIAGER